MKFWAQSLIEASNIKRSPYVLDLQLQEALGCTCRVLDGVSQDPTSCGAQRPSSKEHHLCAAAPASLWDQLRELSGA